MKIKSLPFLVIFLLLSSCILPTIACPPPDCGECKTWNEETEMCDWDCPSGQCCEDDDCVDDCSGCYKCVDDYCESCKCYDEGNPISGSINVQNAKLCEEVIHTSSISDTDHWFKGGDGEGFPTDTVTYSWDKTADSNPESGTFTGATDEASVEWKAPPCTGTVTIKLNANDEPDSMDNPCPDSDRDDPLEPFEETSTVSLPSGCSDCDIPPAPPNPSITETTDCGCCGPGYVGCSDSGGNQNHTLKDLCYDSCNWYAYLDTVDSTFNICRSCPDNPATVACLDDVASMNQTEACDHLENFPNNPVELTDIGVDNWCRDCVDAHEEAHMNKDWKEDSLQPEIDSFACWCADHAIDIDCSESDSTNCDTALTAAEKTEYDTEWGLRLVAAIGTFMAETEDDAHTAALACYQNIYNALDVKCNP